MNTEMIGKTWDSLGDRHMEMVKTFYNRFFDRYPHYRSLFPDSIDRQMKKMVQTMAMVSRLSDADYIIETHMLHVGEKHRDYQLKPEDLEHFKGVFLEVLGEYCGDGWSDQCAQAWNEAFDQVIVPLMMQGLRAH